MGKDCLERVLAQLGGPFAPGGADCRRAGIDRAEQDGGGDHQETE
jgi:hypothetical protein